ncbi:MAG: hypothetical protein WEF86_09275 [Gemmatimonadota bacterium]
MISRVFGLLTATLILCLACAPRPSGAPAGRGNVITSDQMASVNAQSAYEAVQRLRPDWLSTRGPSAMLTSAPDVASVYLGGNYMGPVEALHRIRSDDLQELRYYEPGEASARFGMGHERGVIDVIMKGADRIR